MIRGEALATDFIVQTMFKVMFVCLGNICRSPMAECIFADMLEKCGATGKVAVFSAATSDEEEGNPIYPPAAAKLRKERVPVRPHRAVPLARSDYDRYDLFVGMEQRNISNMLRIFGDDKHNKIMRLLDCTDSPRDIADPWWTGDFDKAFRDISYGCRSLLELLSANGVI